MLYKENLLWSSVYSCTLKLLSEGLQQTLYIKFIMATRHGCPGPTVCLSCCRAKRTGNRTNLEHLDCSSLSVAMIAKPRSTTSCNLLMLSRRACTLTRWVHRCFNLQVAATLTALLAVFSGIVASGHRRAQVQPKCGAHFAVKCLLPTVRLLPCIVVV